MLLTPCASPTRADRSALVAQPVKKEGGARRQVQRQRDVHVIHPHRPYRRTGQRAHDVGCVGDGQLGGEPAGIGRQEPASASESTKFLGMTKNELEDTERQPMAQEGTWRKDGRSYPCKTDIMMYDLQG